MPRQGRGAQDQAQDWATFLSLGRWSQRTARKHEMKGSFCASSCLPEAVLQTQWLKPHQASKVPGHASLAVFFSPVTRSFLSPTGDNIIRKQVLLLPVGSRAG